MNLESLISGFRFADPEFLGLIPLLLIMWLIVFFWQRRNLTQKKQSAVMTGSLKIFAESQRQVSRFRYVGRILRAMAVGALIIGLARPQGGQRQGRRSADGVDIILVIDTSGSMKARDFVIKGERPTRLEVIKSVIADFIDARPNDRIGIVVFGTEAFTQAPLTLDHDVLMKFLEQVDIGVAGEATAIGDGLGTAVARLKDQQKSSNEGSRVVVLLTDGANNAGRMDPLAATSAAKALGVRVHTIGVGSSGQVPIISNGQVVYIKADIDEKLLNQIATETGGVYRRAMDTEALRGVYKEIDRLEKKRIELKDKRAGSDYFFVPLLFGCVFLVLEALWGLSGWRVIPE